MLRLQHGSTHVCANNNNNNNNIIIIIIIKNRNRYRTSSLSRNEDCSVNRVTTVWYRDCNTSPVLLITCPLLGLKHWFCKLFTLVCQVINVSWFLMDQVICLCRSVQYFFIFLFVPVVPKRFPVKDPFVSFCTLSQLHWPIRSILFQTIIWNLEFQVSVMSWSLVSLLD